MVSIPSAPEYRCFVGVDIAAASFTVLLRLCGHMEGRALHFGNLRLIGVAARATSP